MVFRNEVELLRDRGIDVVTYERQNDEIKNGPGKLSQAFNTVWSRKAYKEIKSLIKSEKPDIAHVHNFWYLISPSIFYACSEASVPVVQTIHNFRSVCVNGLLLKNGVVCEECIGKKPWRGVAHGCFRNSKLYSLPVALAEGIHAAKGTWHNMVDTYITLSRFGKEKLSAGGLPVAKMHIKPNFLPHPPEPSFGDGKYIIFLGRLTPEKGVDTLLEGFKILRTRSNIDISLKIVGGGPLLNSLRSKIESKKIPGVELLGMKSHAECMDLLRNAQFMVMPTACYEMFPLTPIEAFACGKPVVASRLGALAEIVEDGRTGLLFEPQSAADLAAKMRRLLGSRDACADMGKRARAEFEKRYMAERNFEVLMNIYEKTVERYKNVEH